MVAARRLRFLVAATFAGATGFVVVLTLMWKDWIERIFAVDPDEHSGSAEWAIVVCLFVLTVVLVILAVREYRRPRVVAAGMVEDG